MSPPNRNLNQEVDDDLHGPGAGVTSPGGAAEDITLWDFAAAFLRYRWMIVILAAGTAALIGVATVLGPRQWTATASFMPQSPAGATQSRLIGLAGQFGIDVGGVQTGESPQFYAQLVRSREILGPILNDTFIVADTAGLFERGVIRGPLVDILGLEADAGRTELQRAAALRWLREEAVSSATDLETGIVRVGATTAWPTLSAEIVSRVVDRVNTFNVDTRQSQAATERRFVEERVEEARADLREAEDALKVFLQQNRSFQNSPELLFEHDRLQRRVAISQQVYATLMESYEQARIAEVRNTPVITVVEPVVVPVLPDKRLTVFKMLLGLMLGGAVGMAVAFVRELVTRQQEGGAGLKEVSELWDQTKAEWVRFLPWRRDRA